MVSAEVMKSGDEILADNLSRMDMFFGMFVFANGIFVGVKVDDKNDPEPIGFWICELLFTFIFFVEWILRWLLVVNALVL